ncbi:hypothetical protein THICB1_110003 [Thiomonas arsenitoxydans]|uniref:Transposase n=1 Tax=Thiomonas arsenitoxydans (strain DSM 22701 / CIP 110005 / 3As) TaxID=426114 RepID=A0ABM9T150_THIA3|nr:hypothetical protein THICB1_110003 [Thiomonas arsenitoxydans]CQR41104.1 hypothetical protein ACO3_70072 [Thiomonas arsenitoxydans]
MATRLATFLIRSADPTEVPPYFWTMSAMRNAFESCESLFARRTMHLTVSLQGFAF